jgi:cysteine-rich repeat protein
LIAEKEGRDCLRDQSVLRLLHRELDREEDEGIHAHLANCADCRRMIAEASRLLFIDEEGIPETRLELHPQLPDQDVPSPPDDPAWLPPELDPGTRVSRYVIGELIGAGTGGTVYRAHDPQLGRQVALKLVRPRCDRLTRQRGEAQALAKLSHPNVVSVYDAGEFEDQVFVVMELVSGTSAHDWLKQRRRAWSEVVAVFVDAGRGLAASHAAGLVHRDFKPDNVIVGADGRARVTDFGLAVDEGSDVKPRRLAGTPAYMAPEQFRGRPADARTDQFSFCVALYRALYAQAPFGDRADQIDFVAFAREVISGSPRPAPEGTDVPPELDRLIRRGLLADPDRRFPSMTALLDEIERLLAGEGADEPGRRTPLRQGAAWLVPLGLIALVFVAGLRNRAERHAALAVAGSCGNGVVEPGEECDDGNTADNDACLSNCRFAACGDGRVRARVEECDDGNQKNGDGCSSRCLRCTNGDERLMWEQNGRCYTRHDRAVSWPEAVATCQALGAHLLTYNVWAELKAVYDHLLHAHPATYWIGLSDRDSPGDYGWVTGEPANPLLRWASVPPPPGMCVSHDGSRNIDVPFKPWIVEDCDDRHGFVCEKEEARVWSARNHAYLLLPRAARFQDAEAACQRMGAHLVTVASAEENAFVGSQFFGALWLGAKAATTAMDFRWITGERFDVQLFAPGDPDRRTVPNCLVLGEDRRWHDRECDGGGGAPYAVVCEVE